MAFGVLFLRHYCNDMVRHICKYTSVNITYTYGYQCILHCNQNERYKHRFPLTSYLFRHSFATAIPNRIRSSATKRRNICTRNWVVWSVTRICHQRHGVPLSPVDRCWHWLLLRLVTTGASSLWSPICPNTWVTFCNSPSKTMASTRHYRTCSCGSFQCWQASSAIGWLYAATWTSPTLAKCSPVSVRIEGQ